MSRFMTRICIKGMSCCTRHDLKFIRKFSSLDMKHTKYLNRYSAGNKTISTSVIHNKISEEINEITNKETSYTSPKPSYSETTEVSVGNICQKPTETWIDSYLDMFNTLSSSTPVIKVS